MSAMNITNNAVVNNCTDKCALSFNYPNSPNCIVTNYGSVFQLSYNIDPTLTPVTFNNSQYRLVNIILVSPSFHLYNGSNTQAELIIMHSDVANPSSILFICIPITSTSNNPSTLLATILNDIVDSNMNKSGDSQSFLIEKYTLNDIIPYKPYYFYEQQENNWQIVAYGIENAIYIPNNILTDIAKYIEPRTDVLFPYTTTLLINKTGPTMSESGEIYIDCKPVDSSTETIEVAFKNQTDPSDIADPTNLSSQTSNFSFTQFIDSIGINSTTFIIIAIVLILMVIYVGLKNLVPVSSPASKASIDSVSKNKQEKKEVYSLLKALDPSQISRQMSSVLEKLQKK
jgi:hypothetical protein